MEMAIAPACPRKAQFCPYNVASTAKFLPMAVTNGVDFVNKVSGFNWFRVGETSPWSIRLCSESKAAFLFWEFITIRGTAAGKHQALNLRHWSAEPAAYCVHGAVLLFLSLSNWVRQPALAFWYASGAF